MLFVKIQKMQEIKNSDTKTFWNIFLFCGKKAYDDCIDIRLNPSIVLIEDNSFN